MQQTQVDRVIPKFEAFMERFPGVQDLAAASLAEVLTQWQGLGYNRRAKYLRLCALAVVEQYGGQFPQEERLLLKLPGIGPYTASALQAFAFNQPTLMIETNIRAVYIHHFFSDQTQVSDQALKPVIKQSLYTQDPRLWYSALMDYGSTLKKLLPNPSRKSKHHTKQSQFQGSSRQVRGEIIRVLSTQPALSVQELYNQLTSNVKFYDQALDQLVQESLVVRENNIVKLQEN